MDDSYDESSDSPLPDYGSDGDSGASGTAGTSGIQTVSGWVAPDGTVSGIPPAGVSVIGTVPDSDGNGSVTTVYSDGATVVTHPDGSKVIGGIGLPSDTTILAPTIVNAHPVGTNADQAAAPVTSTGTGLVGWLQDNNLSGLADGVTSLGNGLSSLGTAASLFLVAVVGLVAFEVFRKD